ncbi:MAG: nucleotidyltransferase domain-containing protein [Candidatus Korarchaeota archaeon]
MHEPHKIIVEKLPRLLKEKYGARLVSIVLFGSVARGEATTTSDIDLLIIAEELPISSMDRTKEFLEVAHKIPEIYEHLIMVSAIIMTPKEVMRYPPILLDIVVDGQILYDKDGFFNKLRQDLQGKLEKLGAKRVRMGKGWYWILKPDYKWGEVITIE